VSIALLAAVAHLRAAYVGYAPPVRMIKLTERQAITPYKFVHPDEDDR
jgi:hypothetical protein